MKKISFVVIIVFLTCTITTNIIYADDEDTLDLNTEDVKNKKDDYSSLTDINGINIFTDDMQSLLKSQEKMKSSKNKKAEKEIFTNNFKIETKQNSNSLFKEKVVFDKTDTGNNNGISMTPFVLIGMIILGFVVFIFTRKYYKWKENSDSENNDNI